MKSPMPFMPITHSYETGLISSVLVTCGYCIGQGGSCVTLGMSRHQRGDVFFSSVKWGLGLEA